MPGSCDLKNNLIEFDDAIEDLNPHALKQLYQDHAPEEDLNFFSSDWGLRLLNTLKDVYPQPADENAIWVLHFLLSHGAAKHVDEKSGRNPFLENIRAAGHYELCNDIERCLAPDYQAPLLPDRAALFSKHSASAQSLGLTSVSSRTRSQRASPIFFNADGLSPRDRQPTPPPRPTLFPLDPATISSSTLHSITPSKTAETQRRPLGLSPSLMSKEDLQKTDTAPVPPLMNLPPTQQTKPPILPPARTTSQSTQKPKKSCCTLA